MKYLKTSIHWTLAILVALALKYSLMTAYSAYNFRSYGQNNPEYLELQKEYKSKPFGGLWEMIAYL